MADTLRLDKFMWFARIVKTRALAQQLAEEGRIRIAGRVADRAHTPVRVGDVLSFALRGQVRVIRVEMLPLRRGPAAEARLVYSELPERQLTSEGGGD
ncbi:MAG TPA: RNA-binding S4 domain-containing protein [Allosphingosinicella sp.]|nr:RNA-binding S4 domain-containing protein [Allosphingosinicella sp.]